MNRFVLGFGVLLISMGAVMHFILIFLSHETFRAGLTVWIDFSYAIIVVGATTLVLGAVGKPFRNGLIPSKSVAKLFGYFALVNAVAAAIFTMPMLYPPFEFPILITEWPGIYIIVAYAFFVVFGVLGMLGWSFVYSNLASLASKETFSLPVIIVQIIFSNLGVYGASVYLFLGGHLGSFLAYHGAGDIIVGASMEFSDIPSAFCISLCILSVLLGVGNFILAKSYRHGVGL